MGAMALAGVALVVSIKARGDGKRSADASERSADASVRSAEATEATLAEQVSDREERRRAAEAASRPVVDLRIIRVDEYRYRLQNRGEATARHIAFDTQGRPPLFQVPEGDDADLEGGHAFEFQMGQSWVTPISPQLSV